MRRRARLRRGHVLRRSSSRTTSTRPRACRIWSRHSSHWKKRRAHDRPTTWCRARGRSTPRSSTKLPARGHEIGVHGYDHSNRTPFADAGERGRSARCGAAVWRSPWRDRLSGAVVAAHAGAAARSRAALSLRQQHPDRRRPVSNSEQRLRDGSAVCDRRHHRTADVAATRWDAAVSRATGPTKSFDCGSSAPRSSPGHGGVVVLLTHCERRFSGNPPLLGAYRRFLEYVQRTAGPVCVQHASSSAV